MLSIYFSSPGTMLFTDPPHFEDPACRYRYIYKCACVLESKRIFPRMQVKYNTMKGRV